VPWFFLLKKFSIPWEIMKVTSPRKIPKANLSTPRTLFNGLPKKSLRYKGATIKINIAMVEITSLFGTATFFLSKKVASHDPEAIIMAPIHNPVIMSSTPKYRESPIPAPTASVQTGQTAKALCAKKKSENKRKKKATAIILRQPGLTS